MRYLFCFTLAGLMCGLLATNGFARDLDKIAGKEAETCGKYGTTVEFVESPSEAARQALKEEKLVLVLHVSGNFETPDFT